MDASRDRPEFAPPPEPALLRAFALAVLAHLLLVLALTQGLQWKRESQDAAVEAELWSAVPQQAAPKEVPVPPPPAPQPVVKAPPAPPPPAAKAPAQPEPPAKREADIALEREKQKRIEEQQRREEELEKQRAEKAKLQAQKKREEELARKKEREEELARRKEQQQKLAEAKRKAEEERKAKLEQQAALEEKKRQQLREETMHRMQAMAGTGAKDSQGSAARSSGPSGSWAGKVQARVRPNIVFSDDVSGNPTAEVEVRLGPGGMILGKPKLVKSSGHRSWDEAVIRALERTESLPADTDGRYPSPVIIQFKPKA